MKAERKKPIRKSIDIRLEELVPDDFPLIRPWIDPGTFRLFNAPVDNSQLKRLLTIYTDGKPTSLGYRIVRSSDQEIIGMIHATIDWNNSLAHIGQIVVGDPTLRGQGIGADSMTKFLRVCFDDLGLHRAQLFVDEGNTGAIVCYQNAGFRIEGLMREAAMVGSNFISWYSMSILENEWRSMDKL